MGLSKMLQELYALIADKIKQLTPPMLLSDIEKSVHASRVVTKNVIKVYNLEFILGSDELQKILLHEKLSRAAYLREKNLSEETKKSKRDKISKNNTLRYNLLTEELKKEYHEKRFGNISEEAELKRREKISKTESSRSKEEWEKITTKRKITIKNRYSDEELLKIYNKQGESLKQYINSLSPELKELRFKNTGKAIKLYYDTRYTEEDRKQKLEKILNTCLERYGCNWFTLSSKIKSSGRMHSKLNQEYSDLFKSLNIEFEEEFNIDNRSFDFKIGRYLLEIDPYATHNSDWCPFGDLHIGIDKNYHRNKTLLALTRNYICIHIFDWVDIHTLLPYILNNSLSIIDKKDIREYIYDIRNKCLVTNCDVIDTNLFVRIYDDGFLLEY